MDNFSNISLNQEKSSTTDKRNCNYKDSPLYGYTRDLDWTNKKHKPYGSTKRDVLFFLYLLSILIWGVLVVFISPSTGLDLLGWIILFIPVVMFAITITTLDYLSPYVEQSMIKSNILSAGILIILPLLTFITQKYEGDQQAMISTVLFAIIFTLLSMIDIWTSERWFTVAIHLKSIFQTMSLTLIIFALYLYYSHVGNLPWTCGRSV